MTVALHTVETTLQSFGEEKGSFLQSISSAALVNDFGTVMTLNVVRHNREDIHI